MHDLGSEVAWSPLQPSEVATTKTNIQRAFSFFTRTFIGILLKEFAIVL